LVVAFASIRFVLVTVTPANVLPFRELQVAANCAEVMVGLLLPPLPPHPEMNAAMQSKMVPRKDGLAQYSLNIAISPF
jgi:hypothetical protein